VFYIDRIVRNKPFALYTTLQLNSFMVEKKMCRKTINVVYFIAADEFKKFIHENFQRKRHPNALMKFDQNKRG